jgi:type I restriction-modification system DNA methylase subunit
MSESIKVEEAKRKRRGAERVKKTAEVFTPMDLCFDMIRTYIPAEKLSDPCSTYLDNSAGDGNFLDALYNVLTEEYGHDRTHVLNNQLYGVEMMQDNVDTIRHRLGLNPSMPGWYHIVCHDALTYDYSFEINPVEPPELW